MLRTKLSRTLRICTALVLATFSTSISQVVVAQTAAAADANHEVICHREGNGGFNAIAPDKSSAHIPNHVEAGNPANSDFIIFATYPDDAKWNDLKAGLDARCAAEDPALVVPAAPTMNDVCGTANDTYTIPNTANVVYKIGANTVNAGTYPGSGTVTITATAAPGFIIGAGTIKSWTLTFTNVSCVVTIANPVVTPSDICGPGNDALVLSTSPNYSLTSDSGWVNGSRTITWTANTGFVFAGNVTTNTQTFTDVNTVCPPTEINLPNPVLTDPCGLNNASWGTQPSIENVTWTLEADGDLIATVVGNYTFPGDETSHNFGKAVDSNTPCPVTKPTAPAVTDPCGLANATWALPSDTAELDWSLANGVLSVQTKAGYEFADHSTLIEFGVAPDSGVLCTTTAAPVTVSDLCGIANDTYTIPEAAHVVYKIGDVVVPAGTYAGSGIITVTASANSSDYLLTSPYTFEYEFDNASCEKVTICHRTNAVKNPYVMIEVAQSAVDGLAGNNGKGQPDHYGEHTGPIATSEDNAQALKDIHIEWGDIIPPVENVHDGLNWTAIGQAMYNNGCNFVTQVTPEAPTVEDLCYNDLDSIVIPSTDGVIYKVNGKVVSGGELVVFDGAPLEVTAEAASKAYLLTDYTGPWTFDAADFSDEQCLTITKTGKVAEDTNKDGIIGAGDTVTWEIIVKNNSNADFDDGFYATVDDENATVEDNGFIGYLAAGESKALTATTVLTADDMKACKAVNTASFMGWRPQREALSLSIVDSEDETPLATGSASAEFSLTCPTPGSGGGNVLTSATTTKLPATLPATGGEPSGPLALVLAMIAAYGAVYFLQGRRQLNTAAQK